MNKMVYLDSIIPSSLWSCLQEVWSIFWCFLTNALHNLGTVSWSVFIFQQLKKIILWTCQRTVFKAHDLLRAEHIRNTEIEKLEGKFSPTRRLVALCWSMSFSSCRLEPVWPVFFGKLWQTTDINCLFRQFRIGRSTVNTFSHKTCCITYVLALTCQC